MIMMIMIMMIIIGRITTRVPKGSHTGTKISCLVEIHNGFQFTDYSMLCVREVSEHRYVF